MMTKFPQTNGANRIFRNGRLAYYHKIAEETYWDELWTMQDKEKLYKDARNGSLGYFEEIFHKFLRKEDLILEAGCGQGQLVIALKARGYQVEGIDFAPETVARLNKDFPELSIRLGDVKNIDVEDGAYSVYISIGVVEHALAGPMEFLNEARRVVRPGGLAFVSVPHINFVRRIKAALGAFQSTPGELPFYQFAFSKGEFCNLLDLSGFDVIETVSYGGYKGTVGEIDLFKKLFELPQGWRIRRWMMESQLLGSLNGHMMMYIARRK